jgi:hypothetical protein
MMPTKLMIAIVATPPYHEHLPYDELLRRFEILRPDAVPVPVKVPSFLNHKAIRSTADIEYLLDEASLYLSRKPGEAIRIQCDWTRIPAYPQAPAPVIVDHFLEAYLDPDGKRYGIYAKVRTHGVNKPATMEVTTLGFDQPAIQYLYYPVPLRGPVRPPSSLPGRQHNGQFEIDPLPPGKYQILLQTTDPQSLAPQIYLGPVWTIKAPRSAAD